MQDDSETLGYMDPLTGLPPDDDLLDATEASDRSVSRIDVDYGAFGRILSEVGSYDILSPLGKGGMGMVFHARHKTLDREVALKLMRPDFGSDERFASRFLREARLAASVEHQNVVTVYDAGKINNLLFMAMKYVDGGDLRQLLKYKDRLPVKHVLRLMIDCARGLCAIHEKGFVHRDIKPANILIAKAGTALIGDLGLARLVTKSEGLTTVGAPVGTPAYMSPEQAQGSPDLDIRTDIYSLGSTMYTALAGQCPFKGRSSYELVAQILMKEPPDIREIAPDVPETVAAIIRLAMHRDRTKRFQSPMELLEALEAEKFAGQRAAANTEDSQISLPPRPLHPVSPESDSRPDSLRFPTEAQAGARRAAHSPADESSASSQAGTTTLSLRGVVGWFKSLLAPGRAPEPSNREAESSEGSWSRDGSGPRRRRRRRVLYRGQDAGES